MNIPRLRELHAAWKGGSIREAELAELRNALPEVLDAMETVGPHCEWAGNDEPCARPAAFRSKFYHTKRTGAGTAFRCAAHSERCPDPWRFVRKTAL